MAFWRGGSKGCQMCIYIHDIAWIFLYYFSKIYNMFLSKIQQSYWYSQLCNYRKTFVFKPISNQLNILLDCNLSFTESLDASSLKMDGQFQYIEHHHRFCYLFSYSTIHAVNLLLWKKMLSLKYSSKSLH